MLTRFQNTHLFRSIPLTSLWFYCPCGGFRFLIVLLRNRRNTNVLVSAHRTIALLGLYPSISAHINCNIWYKNIIKITYTYIVLVIYLYSLSKSPLLEDFVRFWVAFLLRVAPKTVVRVMKCPICEKQIEMYSSECVMLLP